MSHPSRLAVDRYALGEASPEIEAHVRTCPHCRAHLDSVRAKLPLPGWAAAMTAPRPARPWFRMMAFGAAAAAASLALLLRPSPPRTTAKGPPAVTVWLKRGDAVTAWDRRTPLRSGDDIRLEAAAGGYSYLTIVSAAGGRSTTLYQAKLDPSGKPNLSPAWKLDGRGAEEHLAVLFTQAPVDDAQLPPLLSRRDGDTWCIHEILPKEFP